MCAEYLVLGGHARLEWTLANGYYLLEGSWVWQTWMHTSLANQPSTSQLCMGVLHHQHGRMQYGLVETY